MKLHAMPSIFAFCWWAVGNWDF